MKIANHKKNYSGHQPLPMAAFLSAILAAWHLACGPHHGY